MSGMTEHSKVRIVEVGPRDGLQNISRTVPTATKLELIRRLYAAGLQTVEITSIVSPRAIPQLADSHEILFDPFVQSTFRNHTLQAPVLIPNVRGMEKALEAGVVEVAVFVSATEAFSKANINASVAEGLRRAKEATRMAQNAGVRVRGYVSCIFADPYEGKTRWQDVLKVVRELLDTGCYEVSLGDTLGVGTPPEVRNLLHCLSNEGISLKKLAGHFHDTYGQGVANVWEAYQCGLRVFDSSVAGLGGCPFAPGAKGNVATEDLLYLFQQAGIRTGVDLDQVMEIGDWISAQLKQANASRAGAALKTKQSRPNIILSKAPKSVSSSAKKIAWTYIRETSGLQILQSGVNVKLLLNRPNNGNALTESMITVLTQFFEEAATNNNIRRIAIIGKGKFFCTGMDLGKNTSPVAQAKKESDAQYQRLTRLFRAIDQAPQVTIACINGPAFGGGVGLAFVCDIRIGIESATVSLSEVKLGLCPATISKYVIREWGVSFAREAMLSARPISMAELKSLGLIANLAPDGKLDEELDSRLAELQRAAPEASAMSKLLVRFGWTDAGGETQEQGIKELFDKMMRKDGEAALGLRMFREQKNFSWDEHQNQQRLPAKL